MSKYNRLYQLKNNKSIYIREPKVDDADALIKLIKQADIETRFLARNPGEFNVSLEKEKEIIQNVIDNPDSQWFLVEDNDKIIGMCSIWLLNSRNQRYRHRASSAIVLLKDYWNQGIGGKMMQTCIEWAKDKGLEKIELEVVTENQRALKLYESFGFKISGTIHKALKYPDGTYADEYFMELDL